MKYLLKTPYSCLIKTQNDIVELDPNDNLEVEDEKVLFVYPQTANGIPFCINLIQKNESSFYSFAKHQDKMLILLENQQQLQIVQKESLNFSGKNCEIEITLNSIQFSSSKKSIKYNCPHKCNNYKVFKIKSFACVQFDSDLYAYSIDKNKLLHFCGDEMNVEGETLTLTKRMHDSLSRTKTAKYKFDDEVTLESENFEYNENNSSNNLIPFKFLEGVKAKDFKYLRSCLSENLQKSISDENLKKFFGNIQNFLPLTENEYLTISNNQKNYVTFSMKNGKIDDISMDLLR